MTKNLGWVSVGILSLLLGASTALVAQDKPDEVQPPKQDERKPDDAKPRKQQEEAKPPKHDEQQSREQGKAGKEHAQMEHGRPAGKSEHIPDDKFRAHFGRQHTVIINRPVIVEEQPRFQSGGYWFVIVDPWPVGWAYTDECYIDFVDGEYFLFDLLHPEVRVALFVTL
jgi:hypothetical protein